LLKKDQKYACGGGICLIVWFRKPKRKRLTRIKPEPKLELEKMAGQDLNERALNEIFYLHVQPNLYVLIYLS